DIRNLLVWIKKNLLKERPELFIQGDSVRPGILVLINDADWELLVSTSGDSPPSTAPLTALVGKPWASHKTQIGPPDGLLRPSSPQKAASMQFIPLRGERRRSMPRSRAGGRAGEARFSTATRDASITAEIGQGHTPSILGHFQLERERGQG
ncbi:hypothetical protein E2I00_002037, partial [Balaenoptera physalus]